MEGWRTHLGIIWTFRVIYCAFSFTCKYNCICGNLNDRKHWTHSALIGWYSLLFMINASWFGAICDFIVPDFSYSEKDIRFFIKQQLSHLEPVWSVQIFSYALKEVCVWNHAGQAFVALRYPFLTGKYQSTWTETCRDICIVYSRGRFQGFKYFNCTCHTLFCDDLSSPTSMLLPIKWIQIK